MDRPAVSRRHHGCAGLSRHARRRRRLMNGARDVSRFERRDGAARSGGLTAMHRVAAPVDVRGLTRGQRRDGNGDRQEHACDSLRGNHVDDCGPIGWRRQLRLIVGNQGLRRSQGGFMRGLTIGSIAAACLALTAGAVMLTARGQQSRPGEIGENHVLVDNRYPEQAIPVVLQQRLDPLRVQVVGTATVRVDPTSAVGVRAVRQLWEYRTITFGPAGSRGVPGQRRSRWMGGCRVSVRSEWRLGAVEAAPLRKVPTSTRHRRV